MQAQNRVKVIPGQVLALGFALMLALVAGGVGGYEMRGGGLGLSSVGAGAASSAINNSAELARHAASEHADVVAVDGYGFSAELARHGAAERADVITARVPLVGEVAAHSAQERADFGR